MEAESTVRDEKECQKDNEKDNELEIKNVDKDTEINKKLDENAHQKTELQALETNEASTTSPLKASREAVTSHEKRSQQLKRALDDDDTLLSNKKTGQAQVSSTFDNLHTASKMSVIELAEAREKFYDQKSLYFEQLMEVKQKASEANTRVVVAMMTKKHEESSLRELQEEFNSELYEQDQSTIAGHQAEIHKIQTELVTMNFNEERYRELKDSVRSQQACLRTKRDAVHALSARLYKCNFKYTPPPGFDESRVLGTLCRLISVNDPTYYYALEAVAGEKLYYVIVDTEETCQLLLEEGNLPRRATIIPLSSITGQVLQTDILKLAQEIGGGPENVKLALDLISFPASVRRVMEWVFGATLVCRNMDTATRVAFDPRVLRPTVTFQGDEFDPDGVMTGGALAPSVLVQLQELKRMEQQTAEAERQLEESSAKLQASQQIFDKYNELQHRHKMKSYELESYKSYVAIRSHTWKHAQIQETENKLAELTETIHRNKIIAEEATAKANDLKAKLKAMGAKF